MKAKLRTSWISPDSDYDNAVTGFVHDVLRNEPGNRFLDALRQFHEQTVHWGLYTTLSQTLLKLTSPGVPDIYQGQESWAFHLVAPDNRGPVDFDRNRQLLADFESRLAGGEPGGDCKEIRHIAARREAKAVRHLAHAPIPPWIREILHAPRQK
jgi:(1->4)-alpha-D-glucan 1-alpha-D-glucosylmutase